MHLVLFLMRRLDSAKWRLFYLLVGALYLKLMQELQVELHDVGLYPSQNHLPNSSRALRQINQPEALIIAFGHLMGQQVVFLLKAKRGLI